MCQRCLWKGNDALTFVSCNQYLQPAYLLPTLCEGSPTRDIDARHDQLWLAILYCDRFIGITVILARRNRLTRGIITDELVI